MSDWSSVDGLLGDLEMLQSGEFVFGGCKVSQQRLELSLSWASRSGWIDEPNGFRLMIAEGGEGNSKIWGIVQLRRRVGDDPEEKNGKQKAETKENF